VTTETPTPRALKSWAWATRPFSLTASIVPVLVGSALAMTVTGIDWLLFALALMGSVAIQIGTNLTDEYTDHRRHADKGKFLAPHKVIQRGVLSADAVRFGMLVAFGIGAGSGLSIVAQVGWPILAVGLGSIGVAYFYSAGPRPIGDAGLGEVTVFVFMGPLMVVSAYYVQAREVTVEAILVSLPVALLVTAILHCNNLRDANEDRLSGKRTLARALGPLRGRQLYAALLAAAYTAVAAAVATGVVGAWALLALGPLPWAAGAVRMLWRADARPAMNALMVRTAALHWWTGLALAVGLAVSSA
jgi:1,4-dihydroxy-2-naphthoate octaprenyltransferase